MMNKLLTPLSLGLLLLLCAPAPRVEAQAQVPLYAHAYPFSALVEDFGPETAPDKWWMRKLIGDVIDYFANVPPELHLHPLMNPEIGPFLSIFHKWRFYAMLRGLSQEPPPAAGIRLHKTYSSGWIVQSSTEKIIIDFSESVFNPTPWAPALVPLAVHQVDRLADHMDAYLITHGHPDHVSPYLMQAMIQRGKPVFCPAEVKAVAQAGGMPWASSLIVPVHDQEFTIGNTRVIAFCGMQWGNFLNLERTIGDPAHPSTAENNVYLIDANGTTLMHAGDNNEPSVVDWATAKVEAGWSMQIALNLGEQGSDIIDCFEACGAVQRRFLSHELEFTHTGSHFQKLRISPARRHDREVLLWGESIDLDLGPPLIH